MTSSAATSPGSTAPRAAAAAASIASSSPVMVKKALPPMPWPRRISQRVTSAALAAASAAARVAAIVKVSKFAFDVDQHLGDMVPRSILARGDAFEKGSGVDEAHLRLRDPGLNIQTAILHEQAHLFAVSIVLGGH